jgi:hypothetical protein
MKKFFLSIIMIILCSYSKAQLFDFQQLTSKTFMYEIKEGMGVSYMCTTSYNWRIIEGVKYYNYVTIGKYDSWDVITNQNGKPKEITYKKDIDSLHLIFDGSGYVKCTGVWDNKPINTSKQFRENVTLENVLVLQTMDFNKKGKYVFDLIQPDKLPDLVVYRMYFKVTGYKTITTPAGTFDCIQLDFSLTDLRGLFYTAYYWVTNDPKRMLIKIDNIPAMMGKTELNSIK